MNVWHLFLFILLLFVQTDSVKALLGRHTKILIKYMVKLETKGDKTDNRVLVSIFLLSLFFFSLLTSEFEFRTCKLHTNQLLISMMSWARMCVYCFSSFFFAFLLIRLTYKSFIAICMLFDLHSGFASHLFRNIYLKILPFFLQFRYLHQSEYTC